MSAILKNWIEGNGLPDVLVIDGHTHIGEWPSGTTFHSVEEAAEMSVKYMDTNGVDAVCAQSGGYMFPGNDYRLGNDFLLEVCRRVPDRIVGFMNVNPNDRRENILTELDRMFDCGIRCIKLLNAYQEDYPGDGPNLMAVYEYAARRDMLVFNHKWSADVADRISAAFPGVTFVFAHYNAWQDALLKERANVYANIWSMNSFGFLERAVAKAGAGKFLMGSDSFLNLMSVGIGPVVFGAFSDDDKRQILGLTQARLLDGVGALPAALKEKYLKAQKAHFKGG